MRVAILVPVLAVIIGVIIVAKKREKIDFSSVYESAFDKRYERAGLKDFQDIFQKYAEYEFEKVLSPLSIYAFDKTVFIYDGSRAVVERYNLLTQKLADSYFRKGKGEGEILSGTLSISSNKKHLLFNDIQQNRISILDVKDKNLKTIVLKYAPGSSTLFNDKLYFRSFYLNGLVAELDEKGNIVRELKLKISEDSTLNFGTQGGMTLQNDLILVSFRYSTQIYAYSLTGDSVLFIADTPISIPIPKPYFEKSGNRVTYTTNPEKTIFANLDVKANDEFIFALYSGGILGEAKSLTDILFTENAKVINIFSIKDGNYICSAKLSAFVKSFDIQDNKLYAITNLNENELTKVLVYDIDVGKLREISKKWI